MTRQNPRSSSEAIARRAKRGFSLIEAAIVLGVVGAVIGTIWVSAANMYENHKVNKTINDLAVTANNIRRLISLRDAEEIGAMTPSQMGTFLINAGVYPKDWVGSETPLGGDLQWASYFHNGRWIFSNSIYGLTKSACIKIAINGSSNRTLSPFLIITNDYTTMLAFGASAFPITLEQAKQACGSNNVVYFHYDYTRIN